MKLSYAVVIILANLGGLLAADYFIGGVAFGGTLGQILVVALVLTFLNWILKPVLKLVFGPVIVVTFGLAIIVVNAVILYLVDILFKNLSIQGIAALVYTTLIVSLANMIAHAFTRNHH